MLEVPQHCDTVVASGPPYLLLSSLPGSGAVLLQRRLGTVSRLRDLRPLLLLLHRVPVGAADVLVEALLDGRLARAVLQRGRRRPRTHALHRVRPVGSGGSVLERTWNVLKTMLILQCDLPVVKGARRPVKLLLHGEGGVVLICRLVVLVAVGDGFGRVGADGAVAAGAAAAGGRGSPRRDRAGLREQGRQAVEDGALRGIHGQFS